MIILQGILPCKFYCLEKDWGVAILDRGCFGKNSNTFGMQVLKIDSKILLAILNSSVVEYYVRSFAQRRVTNQNLLMLYKTFYEEIPIPELGALGKLERSLVDKMLANPEDKETEAEINRIVYELYDLTPEEIKEIEDALR